MNNDDYKDIEQGEPNYWSWFVAAVCFVVLVVVTLDKCVNLGV